ncbi:MAG: hypothetical protein WCX70_02145 [Candidatus Paceibacterota bacterium]|jgi:hypothetical protein
MSKRVKSVKPIIVAFGETPTVTEVTQMAFATDAFRREGGDDSYYVCLGELSPQWYSAESLEKALADHNERCYAPH